MMLNTWPTSLVFLNTKTVDDMNLFTITNLMIEIVFHYQIKVSYAPSRGCMLNLILFIHYLEGGDCCYSCLWALN